MNECVGRILAAGSIQNELRFHSVRLGGYVCLSACSSEASPFRSARKWRKREILVGLQ